MSDLIICKHNELIENFIFNATESELQILNYAVATTNPAWENKNLVYCIDIPDLVSTYKTKSNNVYKHYRESLRKLMRREYSYRNSKGRLVTENMVIRTVEDTEDPSWLEFKFNEHISFRLSNLKGLFTKYDIKHIAMFKSKYAFMLYEFFKLHLNQANHLDSPIYRKKITVELFKENLGLLGKYKYFRDLEKDVIKVAKKNINDYSDISMSYSVTRKARTPTHIVLSAQYKKGKANKSPEDQTEIPNLDSPVKVENKSHASEMSDEQKAELRSQFKNILNS